MVAISYPTAADTTSNRCTDRRTRPAGAGASTPPISTLGPILIGAVAVISLVVGIRAVQGTPPATGLHGAPVAEVAALDAAAGEATVTVAAGDTLWDLAGTLAPHLDRREAVALLAERNGTSSLQAGQVLIVPAGLIDARLGPSGQLAAGTAAEG